LLAEIVAEVQFFKCPYCLNPLQLTRLNDDAEYKIYSHCLFSASLFGIASCKKEDKRTTSEKLQTKWKLETYAFHRHANGVDSSWNSLMDDRAVYWDIRPDNKIYRMIDSMVMFHVDYILLNDTSILIKYNYLDEEVFRIRNLMDNALRLYIKTPLPKQPG
jgi:hypothetical protein